MHQKFTPQSLPQTSIHRFSLKTLSSKPLYNFAPAEAVKGKSSLFFDFVVAFGLKTVIFAF
jgi:hypothetical protein